MTTNGYIVIGYDTDGNPCTKPDFHPNWDEAMKAARKTVDLPSNPNLIKAHVFYGFRPDGGKSAPKVVDNRPVRTFTRKAQ